MSTASLMLTARKGSPRGGPPWPPLACRSLTRMKPTPGIPLLLSVSTSCCSLPGPGRPPHLAASLLSSLLPSGYSSTDRWGGWVTGSLTPVSESCLALRSVGSLCSVCFSGPGPLLRIPSMYSESGRCDLSCPLW